MKRALAIALAIALALPIRANACDILHTTAYCQGETTATGKKVRQGICATDISHLGMTAILYKVDDNGNIGEFIGIYECEDTGFGLDTDGDGIGSIQEGKTIDIYFPELEDCYGWMQETNGRVYVEYIEAEG